MIVNLSLGEYSNQFNVSMVDVFVKIHLGSLELVHQQTNALALHQNKSSGQEIFHTVLGSQFRFKALNYD